jgi:N-acetylmuramic acid 6-phosphate etherase
VGLIAGGDTALRRAIEGAEDSPEQGAQALKDIQLSHRDVLVGIATSGRTPYVIGGMNYARSQGAKVVALVCNEGSEMAELADVVICAVVGPEVVSGSTRLKAGTATKLILNSLTTAAMIRIGKTYGNLMVDLRATNTKLIARSRRLVRWLTGVDEATADRLLQEAGGRVKIAIVMHHRQTDAHMAQQLLDLESGHLRAVIGDVPLHQIA